MQRSRNYLDLILAASCSKLVETESTPEQNVCRGGEDKSNQNEDEGRKRRSRLTARADATIGDCGRPSKGKAA
jgi:hypothetical protein